MMRKITPITNQETEIMRLLMQGLSNEKIALATGISVNTVKYHLKRVYKKLQVQNRVEAMNKFKTKQSIHQWEVIYIEFVTNPKSCCYEIYLED